MSSTRHFHLTERLQEANKLRQQEGKYAKRTQEKGSG